MSNTSPARSHTPDSSNHAAASRSYIRSIRAGVGMIKFAWFLTICLTLLLLTISLLPVFRVQLDGDLIQATPYLLLGLILLAGVLNMIGSFLYTRDDPRLGAATSEGGMRLLLRLSVTVGLCVGIAGLVLFFSGINAEPSQIGGTRSQPQIKFNGTGVAIGLVGGLAALGSALALVKYTRWLAGRVPDPALVERIDTLTPIVWIVYVLTLLLGTFGQSALVYLLAQLGLGSVPMLIAAVALIALPLVAIVGLWRMMSGIKVHLDALCRSVDAHTTA